MRAKEMLELCANANPNPVKSLAEDVRDSLPADFEMKSEQIRVISEFFGDYANSEYDPDKQGYRMQRSLYVMQMTNFITLNCRRLREQDC
jgi:hypothetical protein